MVSKILSYFDKTIDSSFKHSFINQIIKNITIKIRQSFIAQWFLKLEQEIDVFDSSVVVDKGIAIAEYGVDETEKGFNNSITKSFLDSLINLKSIGLIGITAVITNTVLWFFLKEPDFIGFMIRFLFAVFFIFILYCNISKTFKHSRLGGIIWSRKH